MKNWKNWPYWAKGGIIGIFVMLIIFIIYLTVNPSPNSPFKIFILPAIFGFGTLSDYFSCPFLLNFGWVNNTVTNPSYCNWLVPILTFLPMLITYFLPGAIIGWIYGKIKGRKQIN